MTPSEVAASYDTIAERWSGAEFPRGNGIAQHERAIAFVTRRGQALDAGCICRHLEYDQYPELHLYLIVQRPTSG